MTAMIQDPDDPSRWIVGAASEEVFGAQVGATVLTNVHDPALCAGEWCVVHRPSAHHMRDWPLNWRGDRQLMERICPHGVGHPDPDSLAFHVRNGRKWQGNHGCDGCCAKPRETEQA